MDATQPVAGSAPLAAALAGLGPGAVAVDTEFVRERTYFPQLCLVQLAAGGRILLADALALEDPAPLAALLADRGREKLLHAARQDIEALLPVTGAPFGPVFDTQTAAALLGHPAQVGYADLVRELLGVQLAKGHARTDWSRRPLSSEQLAYAADDVRYLPELAARLRERLAAAGRDAWMAEEAAGLGDIGLYRVDPPQAWRRLKGIERLDRAALAALRALARWREERAIEKDLPRAWVLPDAALFELATARPRTREEFGWIASIPRGTAARAAGEILEAIRAAPPADDAPAPDDTARPGPSQVRRMKALQQRLQAIAASLGIQPEVLATRRELVALVRGERELPVLSGWRRAVVGELLLAEL